MTVDGLATTFAVPQHAQRATLRPFERFFRSAGSVEYVERLASSPTNVIVARWRLEAPDRVAYQIRGGSQAIVIGAHRWDRANAHSRWVESPQTPLVQPVVPWRRATNVWRIAPRTIVFVDPTIPGYFTLEGHARLHMVAAAHFMTDRYVSFGSPRRLRAPR